jgi:nitrogen regulatory protein PII
MTMKRIEAFIASEKTPYVLTALENLGLQATFYESKGMGKGEKYTVSSGKGSGTQKMAYSTRTIVYQLLMRIMPKKQFLLSKKQQRQERLVEG